MRLWTALMGWAALIAVAIALYALGVVLQASPATAGSVPNIYRAAIAIAVTGSIAFLGDLFWLARRQVARNRALRKRLPDFGKVDYIPEFIKAATSYTEAQNRITTAMNAAAIVFTTKAPLLNQEQDPTNRQNIARELSAAADSVSKQLGMDVPTMETSAALLGLCIVGLVRTSDYRSAADKGALVTFRKMVSDARAVTVSVRTSCRELRGTTRTVRARNISLTLNTATRTLEGHLGQYSRTLSSVVRGFNAAYLQIAWKRFTGSIRIGKR